MMLYNAYNASGGDVDEYSLRPSGACDIATSPFRLIRHVCTYTLAHGVVLTANRSFSYKDNPIPRAVSCRVGHLGRCPTWQFPARSLSDIALALALYIISIQNCQKG